MRQIRSGSIINVSTNCAALGVKNLVAYATSKGGIHAMTRQLAVELGASGKELSHEHLLRPAPVNLNHNLQDNPSFKRA